MTSPPRLGIVGYSARALTEAAAGLGFSVEAIDAFGDQDTLDLARCQVLSDWPQGIVRCARHVECDGWLLAGGMEHYGRIAGQLARQAPLLGPSPGQLARLRSLRTWRQLAARVPGLAMPPSSRLASQAAGGLIKPFRSSGGLLVADAGSTQTVTADGDTPAAARSYWQQHIAGRSLGITALITDCRIALCGATESFAAADWPGPRPYIYRGSAGPIELSRDQQQVVLDMAAAVASQIGLTGWLQADFIEDDRGQLWLLEINPRWTAGMEVLHWCAPSLESSPLASHLAAHQLAIPGAPACWLRDAAGQRPVKLAKAVLYAPHPLLISQDQRIELQEYRRWQTAPGSGRWNIADVPAIGGPQPVAIAAGQPVLTLRFAVSREDESWAQTRQALLAGLNRARREIGQRFFSCQTKPTNRP